MHFSLKNLQAYSILLTKLTNFFFGDVKNRKILDHAESRSIADIIIKFLTIDSMSFLTERQEIVDDILQRLSKPTNTNVLDLCYFR